MAFLDTNILLYSISRAPHERAKREVAIALLNRDDCTLSIQVLQEFYVQATRASRADPIPHDIASGLIQTWLRFRIQETTVEVMQKALSIKAIYGFSYWDSAIIAAAGIAGCREIHTEDMTHGRKVDNILLNNPFL